jgi:hypothetical protein
MPTVFGQAATHEQVVLSLQRLRLATTKRGSRTKCLVKIHPVYMTKHGTVGKETIGKIVSDQNYQSLSMQ